jgi:hypothetical protein
LNKKCYDIDTPFLEKIQKGGNQLNRFSLMIIQKNHMTKIIGGGDMPGNL